MAFLRPITQSVLDGDGTTDDMRKKDVHIKEADRYIVSKQMFDADKNIIYIYYFNDDAERNNRFYTFPITRESVAYHLSEKNP